MDRHASTGARYWPRQSVRALDVAPATPVSPLRSQSVLFPKDTRLDRRPGPAQFLFPIFSLSRYLEKKIFFCFYILLHMNKKLIRAQNLFSFLRSIFI